MNGLRASVLLLLSGGLWLALAGFSNEPVSIAVEGARYQYEPATVRLRVRVERDPANRAVIVGIFSDSFERSSLEELPGADAALVRWVDYAGIPAGEYVVVALLQRASGPLRAEDRLTVLGRY